MEIPPAASSPTPSLSSPATSHLSHPSHPPHAQLESHFVPAETAALTTATAATTASLASAVNPATSAEPAAAAAAAAAVAATAGTATAAVPLTALPPSSPCPTHEPSDLPLGTSTSQSDAPGPDSSADMAAASSSASAADNAIPSAYATSAPLKTSSATHSKQANAFRALKPLEDACLNPATAEATAIPLGPAGLLHGKLPNGFTYYVRQNPKPQQRAALALVVRIGSVAEEENERGVAHILEHLAFNATTNFSNHDIVKFLESIGAEFGACQNAYTTTDETVFELFVPVDKPELLSKAMAVLAEFSSEIRVADEDLAKERGAVLEEWRERRNAGGRMQDSHWLQLMRGSKYAERLPIGQEKVIRTVPASVVREFFRRWYRPENMAVVAVGDFGEPKDVVASIAEHFGPKFGGGKSNGVGGNGAEQRVAEGGASLGPLTVGVLERVEEEAEETRLEEKDDSGIRAAGIGAEAATSTALTSSSSSSAAAYPPIPRIPFVEHKEPLFATLVEREAGGTAVMVSCTLPALQIRTVAEYRRHLTEEMGHMALSQRLFKISRRHRPPPPFFSATSAAEPLVQSTRSFAVSAVCRERGALVALEAILTEIARVRLHGFTDREVSFVRSQSLAAMESAFLERDQTYSDSIRDEYIQHFLREEAVPGIEFEARLVKTILPAISAAEIADVISRYDLGGGLVVKVVEPKARTSVEGMRAVAERVRREEEEGRIGEWREEGIPNELVETKPEAGAVLSQTEWPGVAATELKLSNGMRVCVKPTDFLDDQVLISGFAFGGLSEVPLSDFVSAALAQTVASEVGVFGLRPEVLSEVLAGKRVELSPKVSFYTRSFAGEASPSDLETALQLIFLLFSSHPTAPSSHLSTLMQIMKESAKAQQRDPFTAFSNRVREINYGSSPYFKPTGLAALGKLDFAKAFSFFNRCFLDPSSFTVVIIGKVDLATATPMILQYLGGISRPSAAGEASLDRPREKVTPLDVKFPDTIIREDIMRSMVESQGFAQITLPLEIKAGPSVVEDVAWVFFLCKLLETKVMQALRFKQGQIYTASVSPFLGASAPSKSGGVKGDIAISFACDPAAAWPLVHRALSEVALVMSNGPSADDVKTVVELEQRSFETGLHENAVWLERILRSYQSRLFSGDLDSAFKRHEEIRLAVIDSISPESMKEASRRLLPVPPTSLYTAAVLSPLPPFWRRLLSLPPKPKPGLTFETKVLIGVATAVVVTSACWKYFSRR